jgi:betaine lipid synthase
MFLDETTTEQFAIDTLDPVAYNTHINSGAYHYQCAPFLSKFHSITYLLTVIPNFNRVCLEQKYTKQSCPLYLTKDGFELLKADEGAKMNAFRLHTDSIINVIKQLGPNSLTVTVLMDHMDW